MLREYARLWFVLIWSTLGAFAPFDLARSDSKRQEQRASFQSTSSGLMYSVTKSGGGRTPQPDQYIEFRYVGMLEDGTVFDDTRSQAEPTFMQAGKGLTLPPGLREGLLLLRAGSSAVFVLPPELGYGEGSDDFPVIPARSTLRYEVDVLSIKTHLLGDVMFERIQAEGFEKSKKWFLELREKGFPDVVVNSGQLAYLGAGYLYRFNNFNTAIELFKLNIDLYPKDASVHRALANAYFASGDRSLAIAQYEQALKLKPGLKSAADQLAKLQSNPGSPTRLERLSMLLQSVHVYGGILLEAPMNVEFLHENLTQYLASAPASESREAAQQVQLFLGAVQREHEERRKRYSKEFATSPFLDVQAVVGRAAESDREIALLGKTVSAALEKPVELRFEAIDGRFVDLATLRGKVVLLMFWAAWSPNSALAFPHVLDAYKKHNRQGFEVVGVSLDQTMNQGKESGRKANRDAIDAERARSLDQVRAFIKEQSLPWPQHYDGAGWENEIGKRYLIKSIPKLFLFDTHGTFVGEVRPVELSSEVEALLKHDRS